jgi:AcrR family transcriptional regulator
MARPVRKPGDTPPAEKILLAATELFDELGFERSSMKAIADRAECTAGGLYYHFENKEEILFRILEFGARRLVDSCTDAVRGLEDDPKSALEAFVAAHISTQSGKMSQLGGVYTAWVHGMKHRTGVLSTEQRKLLTQLERRHLELLRTILKRGRDSGVFRIEDVTLTAFAIIGMAEHVIYWLNPGGRYSADDVAKTFARNALTLALAT